MPVAEYLAWQAYYEIEPFGEMRADSRSGMICATMANIKRGPDTDAYSPADFMPYLEKPEPEVIGADLDPETHSRLIMAMFGKTE